MLKKCQTFRYYLITTLNKKCIYSAVLIKSSVNFL